MTREKFSEITSDTRVRLGTVVSIIILLLANLGGVVTLVARDMSFRNYVVNKLDDHSEELELLRATKRDKGINSWNRASMKLWTDDLREFNPELNVPESDNYRYYSAD